MRHCQADSGVKFNHGFQKCRMSHAQPFWVKIKFPVKGSFKRCILPAMPPTLEKGLPNRSQCLVRTLQYYLDRIRDVRAERNKLFIAFKKDFNDNTKTATVSSWIKQVIKLANQGWVPRKAAYLTDLIKNRNSVIMIIIIANNI